MGLKCDGDGGKSTPSSDTLEKLASTGRFPCMGVGTKSSMKVWTEESSDGASRLSVGSCKDASNVTSVESEALAVAVSVQGVWSDCEDWDCKDSKRLEKSSLSGNGGRNVTEGTCDGEGRHGEGGDIGDSGGLIARLLEDMELGDRGEDGGDGQTCSTSVDERRI